MPTEYSTRDGHLYFRHHWVCRPIVVGLRNWLSRNPVDTSNFVERVGERAMFTKSGLPPDWLRALMSLSLEDAKRLAQELIDYEHERHESERCVCCGRHPDD